MLTDIIREELGLVMLVVAVVWAWHDRVVTNPGVQRTVCGAHPNPPDWNREET
jgi:hypothetical protein